jgi:hypothetical protein
MLLRDQSRMATSSLIVVGRLLAQGTSSDRRVLDVVVDTPPIHWAFPQLDSVAFIDFAGNRRPLVASATKSGVLECTGAARVVRVRGGK